MPVAKVYYKFAIRSPNHIGMQAAVAAGQSGVVGNFELCHLSSEAQATGTCSLKSKFGIPPPSISEPRTETETAPTFLVSIFQPFQQFKPTNNLFQTFQLTPCFDLFNHFFSHVYRTPSDQT